VAHKLLQRGVIVEAARIASFLREDEKATVLSHGHPEDRDAVLTRLVTQGTEAIECRVMIAEGNGTVNPADS
jgi:hypothetical protein